MKHAREASFSQPCRFFGCSLVSYMPLALPKSALAALGFRRISRGESKPRGTLAAQTVRGTGTWDLVGRRSLGTDPRPNES